MQKGMPYPINQRYESLSEAYRSAIMMGVPVNRLRDPHNNVGTEAVARIETSKVSFATCDQSTEAYPIEIDIEMGNPLMGGLDNFCGERCYACPQVCKFWCNHHELCRCKDYPLCNPFSPGHELTLPIPFEDRTADDARRYQREWAEKLPLHSKMEPEVEPTDNSVEPAANSSASSSKSKARGEDLYMALEQFPMNVYVMQDAEFEAERRLRYINNDDCDGPCWSCGRRCRYKPEHEGPCECDILPRCAPFEPMDEGSKEELRQSIIRARKLSEKSINALNSDPPARSSASVVNHEFEHKPSKCLGWCYHCGKPCKALKRHTVLMDFCECFEYPMCDGDEESCRVCLMMKKVGS